MNIADIITEFGAHYLANRANLTNLRSKLFIPNDTEIHFPIIPCASDKYETAYGVMTRVTQPWKQTWSPINPLTMKPKTIFLQKLKIDIDEQPDKLEGSWLAFLARPDAEGKSQNLDRKTWPFIRWYLEEYLIPQHREDMCMNEDFWGIQTAPPAGATPGAAGTIYDGLKKQIEDNITGGITNLVPTGALDANNSDFVEQLEDWVSSILSTFPFLNGRKLKLFMNANNGLRYKKGFRKLYGTDGDFVTLSNKTIIDTQVEVASLNSMLNDPANPGTKSSKIFLTLPENCNTFVKLGNNKDYFQVESNKRDVSIFTDYFRTVGFQQDRYVWSNELD